MKTQNTPVASSSDVAKATPVASSKASKNTPVASSSDVAKATPVASSKAQTKAVEKAQTKAVEKAQTKAVEKAQTKKGVFAIVAGTIVSIEHKALKKAIGYHVAKGNLKRLANGIGLTEQGAKDWNSNRVAHDPEQFQKIAAFVNGGSNLPEFGGEKKTPVKIGSNKQLPSLEFWGSFATMNMRLCFASLWASK